MILTIFSLCSTYDIVQSLQISCQAENTILLHTLTFVTAVPFAWTTCRVSQNTLRYPLWPNSNVTFFSWPQPSQWPHSKIYTSLWKHWQTLCPSGSAETVLPQCPRPRSNLTELLWFTYVSPLYLATFSFLFQKPSPPRPVLVFPVLAT